MLMTININEFLELIKDYTFITILYNNYTEPNKDYILSKLNCIDITFKDIKSLSAKSILRDINIGLFLDDDYPNIEQPYYLLYQNNKISNDEISLSYICEYRKVNIIRTIDEGNVNLPPFVTNISSLVIVCKEDKLVYKILKDREDTFKINKANTLQLIE